jgi:hypothetical protein
MLRVDVKVLRRTALLTCHGDAIAGDEAGYLFDLLTRDHKRDVVLDVDGVKEIGSEGFLVIRTAREWLSRMGRRLFLNHA